jgi:undecaprenyl-diphosphatase
MIAPRMFGYLAAGDHRLMRRVNRWRPPRWFQRWMLLATRAGDGWLWYGLGIAVLAFGGPERYAAVCAAGGAILCGIVLFTGLKQVSRRRRPCAIERHCWSNLLPPDQFSFPSGHSITAFACAVPMSLFYPEAAPALFFAALSIAASRVLLGMHFLSDVVAGCILGAGLGYSAFHLIV